MVNPRKPPGAPEPDSGATIRCERFVVGLRVSVITPTSIEKLRSGGWVVRWRSGEDRHARYFWNGTKKPELETINEDRVADYTEPVELQAAA